MGDTFEESPEGGDEAEDGTIRSLYADSMTENAVHGSDSQKSANSEIAFFFDE